MQEEKLLSYFNALLKNVVNIAYRFMGLASYISRATRFEISSCRITYHLPNVEMDDNNRVRTELVVHRRRNFFFVSVGTPLSLLYDSGAQMAVCLLASGQQFPGNYGF